MSVKTGGGGEVFLLCINITTPKHTHAVRGRHLDLMCLCAGMCVTTKNTHSQLHVHTEGLQVHRRHLQNSGKHFA